MDKLFLPAVLGGAAVPGEPGTIWRNGSGPPSNSLGVDGDYYLNDDNGDVYQKQSGVYVFITNISGGGSVLHSKFREIPIGTQNGVNPDFVIANSPFIGTDTVYLNGLLQDPPDDYTLSGTTITFVNPPISGDKIRVSYQY